MGPRGGWTFSTGPANTALPPFGGFDPATQAQFGVGGRAGGINFNFNMFGAEGSTRTNTVTAPTLVIPNGGTGAIFDGSVRPFVMGVVPVVGDGIINGAPRMPPMAPTYVSPLQDRLQRLKQGETPRSRPAVARSASDDPEPRSVARNDDSPLVLNGGKRSESAALSKSAAAGDSSANHGDVSVAEIRRQQAQTDNATDQEIAVRLEKARSYEEAGKFGIAKIYYQQAAARATGNLKKRLLEKIQTLGASQ
jgi:hypothetical protein